MARFWPARVVLEMKFNGPAWPGFGFRDLAGHSSALKAAGPRRENICDWPSSLPRSSINFSAGENWAVRPRNAAGAPGFRAANFRGTFNPRAFDPRLADQLGKAA